MSVFGRRLGRTLFPLPSSDADELKGVSPCLQAGTPFAVPLPPTIPFRAEANWKVRIRGAKMAPGSDLKRAASHSLSERGGQFSLEARLRTYPALRLHVRPRPERAFPR